MTEETEATTQETQPESKREAYRKMFFITAGALMAFALAAGLIEGFPGSQIPWYLGGIVYLGATLGLAKYYEVI